MTRAAVATIVSWGFAVGLILIALAVLAFILDQRKCPKCGSDSTKRYDEARICRDCGASW